MVPQNCSLFGVILFVLKEECMKVILVAGKAGSGKTYLGSCLVELAKEKGIRALQTEYSKYVKMYAREILGYEGNRENKPRGFLQETGTLLRKRFGENFFVQRMLEDFFVYENYFDLVVISDVRLRQEIKGFRNSKYKEVIAIRVENDLQNPSLSEEQKKHETEIELENYEGFDYNIKDVTKENIKVFASQLIEGLNNE